MAVTLLTMTMLWLVIICNDDSNGGGGGDGDDAGFMRTWRSGLPDWIFPRQLVSSGMWQ